MAILQVLMRIFWAIRSFLAEFFRITIYVLPNGTRIGLWIFPLVLLVILGVLGIGWFINRR